MWTLESSDKSRVFLSFASHSSDERYWFYSWHRSFDSTNNAVHMLRRSVDEKNKHRRAAQKKERPILERVLSSLIITLFELDLCSSTVVKPFGSYKRHLCERGDLRQ